MENEVCSGGDEGRDSDDKGFEPYMPGASRAPVASGRGDEIREGASAALSIRKGLLFHYIFFVFCVGVFFELEAASYLFLRVRKNGMKHPVIWGGFFIRGSTKAQGVRARWRVWKGPRDAGRVLFAQGGERRRGSWCRILGLPRS